MCIICRRGPSIKMRFKNEGIAFAHLTLPPDTFAREVSNLREELTKRGLRDRSDVAFLAGQSDVLLELRLADLRRAFSINYDSMATGTNWIFAVPYDHPGTSKLASTRAGLRYIIHLRVNREVYRAHGAEADKEIVDSILALAAGGLSAEVSAGFGWSDLLVSGTFIARKDFIAFLSRLHHLRVPAEPAQGQDAFKRILTLVGFSADAEFGQIAKTEVVHPIILARCAPAHIRRAADFLEWKGGGRWRKVVLDGKWDLVIFLEQPTGVSTRGFLAHHHSLITSGRLQWAGVQRLETHLLSQETDEDHQLAASEESESADTRCDACVYPESQDELPKSAVNSLPDSLTLAIRNVLSLFRAASREGHSCCDIVPSLTRCRIGLDRLLRHHGALDRRLRDVATIDTRLASPSASRWFPHVIKARRDIEEWCTYAERIVSQRTVGRFEEFLAQDERVVSYRGGIQKLLYLADELLNSYAKRVYAPSEEPALMSLYDPVDVVESMRVVGFVRIPVRYVFALPLAIAHLWHEVGVHWFYSKYWNPQDPRSRKRAFTEYDRIASARPHDESASEADRIDMLTDLADIYGDAVTLAMGFRGDLAKFTLSLGATFLESHAFETAPSALRNRFLIQLLVRLYLALEFSQRCAFVREYAASEAASLSRKELDAWEPHVTTFVAPAIARIATVLRNEVLNHERYKTHKRYGQIEITDEIEGAAVRAIGRLTTVVHRRYLSELAWEIGATDFGAPSADTMAAFERIMQGEEVTLSSKVDINDLFLLVQQAMIGRLREMPHEPLAESLQHDRETFLQPVAALVRSSLMAFYQRLETPRHRRSEEPTIDSLRRVWSNSSPTPITGHDLFGDEDI